MAVWDPDDLGLEWQLVQNGFCTAFQRTGVLEATALWLADRNYRVVWFDAARWTDWDALDDDFAMNLDFPNYYGRNSNALIDCLRDVAELSYGWSHDDKGLFLCWTDSLRCIKPRRSGRNSSWMSSKERHNRLRSSATASCASCNGTTPEPNSDK